MGYLGKFALSWIAGLVIAISIAWFGPEPLQQFWGEIALTIVLVVMRFVPPVYLWYGKTATELKRNDLYGYYAANTGVALLVSFIATSVLIKLSAGAS